MQKMRNLNILIKPASGRCNMHCTYCFYKDEMQSRETDDYGLMTLDTAYVLIDKAFELAEHVVFMFQGGEPTLRGLDFFRSFVSYAEKKGAASFALQTNGYLLNSEWFQLFSEHHFLIGLSIDGPKVIHDEYRKDNSGRGTFERVFNTSRLLAESCVDFNALVTVNGKTAENAELVYSFLKRNGMRYQQYIPCIDPIDAERGSLPFSLSPETYGHFLIELFRLYERDWRRGDYVSIRYFDNLVLFLAGFGTEECGMIGECSLSYAIEADGSVYPCDFYVIDRYRLGNIADDSFAEIDRKRQEIGFVEKSREKDPGCLSCRYFPICRGGCRRYRESFLTGSMERNHFCASYRMFFDECLPQLIQMAEKERSFRESKLQ